MTLQIVFNEVEFKSQLNLPQLYNKLHHLHAMDMFKTPGHGFHGFFTRSFQHTHNFELLCSHVDKKAFMYSFLKTD